MELDKPIKLSDKERVLLIGLCDCEEGKGLPLSKEGKKIANSLVKKGLAWTLESVFRVAIATEEGRAWVSENYPLVSEAEAVS